MEAAAANVSALSRLLSRLGQQMPMLDAQRAGAELYGAPRLSFFQLFAPNEIALSRILADLFDPKGSHGQQTLFLNALLAVLGLPRVAPSDVVHVNRGVFTDQRRRIDIVIAPPNVLLGIENKPWAVQQPDQLIDYLQELHRRARGKPVRLIFLSDQAPQSAKNEVVPLRYQKVAEGISLHATLTSVLDRIKAPIARILIEEFIRYIGIQFGEETVTVESDLPYVEAVQAEFSGGEEKKKAIAAVLLAQANIHDLLLSEISDFIVKQLQDNVSADYMVDSPLTLREALHQRLVPWKIIRKGWPANCALCIEAGKYPYETVYYGVQAPDGTDKLPACPERRKLEKLTSLVQGSGRMSPNWVWWQNCQPSRLGLEIHGQTYH